MKFSDQPINAPISFTVWSTSENEKLTEVQSTFLEMDLLFSSLSLSLAFLPVLHKVSEPHLILSPIKKHNPQHDILSKSQFQPYFLHVPIKRRNKLFNLNEILYPYPHPFKTYH